VRTHSGPVALESAIARFVAHQRVFGRRYYSEEYVLRALQRFVARRRASDLSAEVFEQWCAHGQLSPNTRRARQLLVRKLCLFRRRREPRCFVPDPTGFARPRPYRSPVIVTSAQVAGLLRAAGKLLPSQHFPLRPAVMRIAIVLLYTAGLRRGELIRLLLADVDAHNGILRIRESKFHRSRWVPLSPDACLELRAYLRQRLKAPYDQRPTAPLLCNGSCSYGRVGWHAYTGAAIWQAFRQLFDQAGIRDDQGRRPRLHDMRHSYAVEALCRCYREGGDVQTQLPKLALYMGHVSIESTAYYLHFIPEVAALASERFDRHYSHIIGSDTP
jgi:integrase/recombinase XerD